MLRGMLLSQFAECVCYMLGRKLAMGGKYQWERLWKLYTDRDIDNYVRVY